MQTRHADGSSSSAVGSYVLAHFAVDADQEIERLDSQVDLFWRQELQLYERLGLGEGGRLLDCGCGSGYLLTRLHQRFPGLSTCGLELDERLCALARERCQSSNSDCAIHQGSVTSMPFPDDTFDFVIARLVLEHVPDVALALQEIVRVLKRGGRAVIIDNDFDLHERTAPDSPALSGFYEAYCRARREEQGHPCIGRELPVLLKGAGFRKVDLQLLAAHSEWTGDQAFSRASRAGIPAQLVRQGYFPDEGLNAMAEQRRLVLSTADHSIFRMLFAGIGEKGGNDQTDEPREPLPTTIGRTVPPQSGIVAGTPEIGTIERFIQEALAPELKLDPSDVPRGESLVRSGVDSMAATLLVGALEGRFGIRLNIAEILSGNSVSSLASLVTSRLAASSSAILPRTN